MQNGFKLKKIYNVGYCRASGFFAERKLGFKKVRFYARAFLIEHPQKGLVLIDTGYGKKLTECTQKGLYSLYKKLIPFEVSEKDSLINQLKNDRITPKDLSYLIVTHFHPDHIGALNEFTDVPWIYREDTLCTLQRFSKLRGLKHGFISPLVPDIPKNSKKLIQKDFQGSILGFSAYDLFHDGSLFLTDLPGHALGQMGVLIDETFFCADAMWSENADQSFLSLIFQQDPKCYVKTFSKLMNLKNTIKIYPTHTCGQDHD